MLDEVLLSMHGETPPWRERGWSIQLARQGTLVWACSDCIKRRRAVRARPWLQEPGIRVPRLAYFDLSKGCRTCGQPFVFGSSEQRTWFEVYKLPPDAEPVDCRPCRSVRRRRSQAATQLAARLKTFNPRDPAELAELATLYLAIGSTRKAAEFLRRAKNKASDPQQLAQIHDQLAALP